jgi:hypothetical protein
MRGGITCANSVARVDAVDSFLLFLLFTDFSQINQKKRRSEASKFSLQIHELVFYFCSDGVDASRLFNDELGAEHIERPWDQNEVYKFDISLFSLIGVVSNGIGLGVES